MKRTKPVKRVAAKLLKKKYPQMPEPARKKAAEILEQLFEKYGTDPVIDRARDRAREMDEDKDLEHSLFEQLKKTLEAAPVLQ